MVGVIMCVARRRGKTIAGQGSTQYTHYSFVDETMYTETRKLLHAYHSDRAAKEYLPPGHTYPKYEILPGRSAFSTNPPPNPYDLKEVAKEKERLKLEAEQTADY